MALGIFEQLAWLTKKVKQLCCIVENSTGGCGDCPVTTDGTTITGNGTVASPLVSTATSPISTTGTGLYSNSPASAVPTDSSIYFGFLAGQGSNATDSILIGNFAGGTVGITSAVFIGSSAGSSAANSYQSVFVGKNAGSNAISCRHSAFIGESAGGSSNGSYASVAIGRYAGSSTTNAYNSVFLGSFAGNNSSGHDVTAIGYNAGAGNTKSGVTILANATLPSYINRAAAVTDLSSGVAGNTYLYYNETTFAIEGVRL